MAFKHTSPKAKKFQGRFEQKKSKHTNIKTHGIQPSILGNLYSTTRMHVHTFYA